MPVQSAHPTRKPLACTNMSESRNGKLYMGFGLDGRFAKEFDLKEIARLFEEKHGYPAKEVFVTAGGSTCLAGPLNGDFTLA